MKVEVTHWDRRGEEISSEIIDVGELDRAGHQTVEAYDEEVSQAIHDAIESWLFFPGSRITFTIPDDEERTRYSAMVGLAVQGPRAPVASAESLDGGCVLYRLTAFACDRTVATSPERRPW